MQRARQLYQSILETDPGNAEANHRLGVLAYQAGRHDIAAQLIAKAVLRDDSQAPYLNNLGLVLRAQGKLNEALVAHRQAVALDPGFSDARVNCGIVLQALGRLDEALCAYEQALAANPAHADAHNGRGLVLLSQGKLGEALASFRQALSIDPGFAEAHNNRGNALEAQGRIGEALAAYRHALAIEPDFSEAHSNLLLCSNYDAGTNARALLAAHRQWNARHAAGLADGVPPHTNAADPTRRLRIGYVSADFRKHPVASFVEPLLTSHDRRAFDVVCYSNGGSPDEVTERLRKAADTWRSIAGLPDERAAELVREDGIDILVDLAGHTGGHRLRVFARKPAPIQITYLGYPGTTGLAAMDYRLTDAWTDPPGWTEAFYTEELVRLPAGSLCFQPPLSGPEVVALPALSPGNVTFASFNNAAKVSPEAVTLWSKVLAAVPDAQLVLKSKSFGDRETVERLRGLFEREGIAARRLEFVGWVPASEEHLALYDRAHIALDTFPYSGCTTTCEALWMGVPVITLARGEPRSRMSLSVLRQVGLDDFIAESPEAYVDIAAELAADIGTLRMLRSGLRETMKRSCLLDATAFTRTVEFAYRDMWKRWCAASA